MEPTKCNARELRFLLTSKCNYDCYFCHKEGIQCAKKDLLTGDDYVFLYKVGREYFGLDTVTLTGGEPLVRNDVVDIARKLYDVGCKTTLTTNGSLLASRIEIGKYISKVNLSFHTLDPKKYEAIVRRTGMHEELINSLTIFRNEYPELPICLNITLVRGINDDENEIRELILYAEKFNIDVKFIELFPVTSADFIPLESLKPILQDMGFAYMCSVSRKLVYTNSKIKVGLIKIFCANACDHAEPGEYCHNNNDLFVSPDGKIKPCRNSRIEIDLLHSIIERDEQDTKYGIEYSFSIMGKHCCYSTAKIA